MPQRKNKGKKVAFQGQGAYKLPNVPASLTRGLQYAAETAYPKPKKTNTWQNKVARSLGGLAGGVFGPVGAALGDSAGGALARWLGYGKYTVSKNSLVLAPNNVPSMHSNKESIILRHREYICDVETGSANGFNVNNYNLNPGLNTTFPWGSDVAQAFQEWKPRGIIFEYVSTSADALNSTNTALGTVIMATQYRASASSFVSKTQMENEYFSCSGKPSMNLCHPIECNPKEDPYNVHYVRGSAVPSGDDIKTYDTGLFSIATTGFQASNVVIGELWVSYEVELLKPSTAEYSGNFLPETHISLSSGITATTIFTGNAITFDNIGTTATANIITFPKNMPYGAYMVQLIIYGGSASLVTPTFTGAQGIVFDSYLFNHSSGYSSNSGSTSTTLFVTAPFTYTQNNNATAPTITLGGAGTLPTSVTGGDLFITQLNTQAT